MGNPVSIQLIRFDLYTHKSLHFLDVDLSMKRDKGRELKGGWYRRTFTEIDDKTFGLIT